MKKVLITGITGFVGSHLADYLLELGNYEIYGTYRWRSRMDNIEHIKDKINLVECDLNDVTNVKKIISEIRPEIIFHLAAQSFVQFSWQAPAQTLSNNIISELNILEAVRECKINPIIQIAGSSEEYGMVTPEEIPIKETTELRPLSPYAVSKATQDYLGYQYYKSYGLNVIRTRSFNHTGARRGDVFVESTFAKQLVEIEKGKPAIIKIGNLDSIRDFLDVKDVVKAYVLCVEKGKIGEVYNICSGIGIKIHDLLDKLIELSNVDKTKIIFELDETRLRPSDLPILVGSHDKLTHDTGWKPQEDFENTLKSIIDYWREKLK